MTPYKISLLIVFICVVLANFVLSPILSDGNQFADDPETRVAAAGYAFAIWGIIFAGMLMFPLYLIIAKLKETPNLKRAIAGLIIAGLASIAFVPISIYSTFTVGWFDILAHLIPLIITWFSLRRFAAEVPATTLGAILWPVHILWPVDVLRMDQRSDSNQYLLNGSRARD